MARTSLKIMHSYFLTAMSKPMTQHWQGIKKLAIATWGILLISLTACSRNTSNSATANSVPTDKIVIDLGWNEYVHFRQGFDPIDGWSWDSYGEPLLQSRLLRRDINKGLVMDLAQEYNLSSDRQVWTVKIRLDVRFSDGTPLTAEDVAYTFNKEAESGLEKFLDKAVVTGGYEVKFYLKKPNIIFVDKLASLGIVPKHAHSETYSRSPIGSGPYKLVQWVEGEQIVLEANPYYYGQKPSIKRVVLLFTQGDAAFAAARSGRAQIAKIPYPLAKHSVKGMELYQVPNLDHTVALLPSAPDTGQKNDRGYATGNNVTSDRAIRQAINYAINRQTLVDAILWGYGKSVYGYPSGPPWQESAPAIADDDINKAKQILAEAGWLDSNGNGTVDKQGTEAEFTLLYMASLPHELGLAMAIAQMLEPVGIRVKPEGSSWEQMKHRIHHDAWLYTLTTRSQDLFALYRSPNGTPNGRPNYSNYTNPTVDRILDRGLGAADEIAASKFWKQVHWNGQTGIGTQGDAASAWLVNLHETYLVSECLDIGRKQMPSERHQGRLLSNITEWKIICNP
ncbi:MAG: ABC transporter substrate-binding protein [Cyanobacteria bacterium P01_G01_bin.19]